jgi:hypothetical protein
MSNVNLRVTSDGRHSTKVTVAETGEILPVYFISIKEDMKEHLPTLELGMYLPEFDMTTDHHNLLAIKRYLVEKLQEINRILKLDQ